MTAKSGCVSATSAKLGKGGSVYLGVDVPDFRSAPVVLGGLSIGYAEGARVAVAEAAVIGISHPKWSERPLLIVVLKPGQTASKQDILAFLQESSAEMQKLARAGKCWDTAEKEFTMPKYEKWPGYAAALQFVGRRYCGLWGRGT